MYLYIMPLFMTMSMLMLIILCSYCCVRAAPEIAVSVSTISHNAEPSLNLHNLNSALEMLPDEEWYNLRSELDLPSSLLGVIRSKSVIMRDRKSALFHTYLTSHPAPSWQHVACALYNCYGGKFRGVQERVRTMFPTGENGS